MVYLSWKVEKWKKESDGEEKKKKKEKKKQIYPKMNANGYINISGRFCRTCLFPL